MLVSAMRLHLPNHHASLACNSENQENRTNPEALSNQTEETAQPETQTNQANQESIPPAESEDKAALILLAMRNKTPEKKLELYSQEDLLGRQMAIQAEINSVRLLLRYNTSKRY